jgi:hypothetical protein
MTTEEHVVTAETHLGYAEGHLQPSEEHLTDAEVHLKLVKAHLPRWTWQSRPRQAPWRQRHHYCPNHQAVRLRQGGPERHPWRERGVLLPGPGWDLCSGGGSLQGRLRKRPPLERGRNGRVLSTSARIQRPTP